MMAVVVMIIVVMVVVMIMVMVMVVSVIFIPSTTIITLVTDEVTIIIIMFPVLRSSNLSYSIFATN